MWTRRHIAVSLEYFSFSNHCGALTRDVVTVINRTSSQKLIKWAVNP